MKAMAYEWVPISDVETYLTDDDWVAEQKLDGVRCLADCTGERIEFRGRGGEVITFAAAAQHFPALREELAGFGGSNAILDGELLPDGTYVVFDVPWCLGPLDAMHFQQRRLLLENIATAYFHGRVSLVAQAVGEVEKRALWHAVVTGGREGICLKRRRGLYRTDGKRTRDVLKVKVTHTVDVVVLERNTGAPGSMNATLGLYRDGLLIPVGGCSMIGKPDLQPGDVCEVEFLYVPDASAPSLYQPRLVRARPDKEPTACTWDQLQGKTTNRQIIEKEPTMSTATIARINLAVTAHQRKLAEGLGLKTEGNSIVFGADEATDVARELEAKIALTARGKRGPLQSILDKVIATGHVTDTPTTIPESESGEPDEPVLVAVIDTLEGPVTITDDGVRVATVMVESKADAPARPVLLKPADGRACRFGAWEPAEQWARELITSAKQVTVVVLDEAAGRQATFSRAN